MSRSKPLVVKRAKSGLAPVASLPARQHDGMPAPIPVVADVPPRPGRKVRDNGTRKKTFYIPDELCRTLRHHCATEDTDETKVVVAALRKYLRYG